MNWVKDKLRSLINLTDVEERRRYLGATFKRRGSVLILYQTGYIRRMPERSKTDKAKTAPIPMGDNTDNLFEGAVTSEAGQRASRGFPYRELLGSLLCLSIQTRPDFTLAVSVLSRFSESLL